MSESETQPKKIYFPHLDPLRFLAAFMIVISHAYGGYKNWFGQFEIFKDTFFSPLLDRFTANLGIGVDVFFLISGFLITYILIVEKENLGKISFKKFYFRRILRIWPLYFFLVALGPFLVSWVDLARPHYLSTILFYNNFNTMQIESWYFPFAHFWSICIEEHFYIVWPIVIAFTPKRYLLHAFGVIISVVIFYKIYVFYTYDYKWFIYYLHTLCKIDVMVIGGILAYYHSIKPIKLNIHFIYRILIYLCLIALLFFDDYHDDSNLISVVVKKYIYVFLFSFAFLIYNFNVKAFLRFKPNSIFHYFGRTSYGIYMYSNILLVIIIRKVMLEYHTQNPYLYWSLNIATALLIPLISYEIIEKRFLKLKDKFSNISTRH